jgi:hypothetical protein
MTGADGGQNDMVKTKISQASTKLRRPQDTIKAGVSPLAVVEAINEAQAELEAAQAWEALRPESRMISRAEVYAMIVARFTKAQCQPLSGPHPVASNGG